ncbi:MAG: hypothetical protein ACUVXB_15530 [Bryobacteraceae bacterium]
MPVPSGGADRDAAVARVRDEIARLRLRMRSTSDFHRFKPGLFYYLFSFLASLLVPLLVGVGLLGLKMLALAGVCFGLLCWAPVWVNRLRYWRQIRRPNRRLERRIAALRAEIDRLKASAADSSLNPGHLKAARRAAS